MSYARKAEHIYQDSRTGRFYERPKINGRRTWRKLDGHSLKLAKESFAQRRADVTRAKLGLVQSPYAPKEQPVKAFLDAYEKAGCPNRHGHPLTGGNLDRELYRLKTLRPFWEPVTQIHPANDCRRYFAWRQQRRKKKDAHCGRAVDLELNSLANALGYGVATGRLLSNPLAERPRFRPRAVRHCRDVAPLDAEELHAVARELFQTPRSEVLGWQFLLEGLTGCRTSEVLRLRWDAGRHKPGYVDGDWLWLSRSKNGTNPFASIHGALRQCLDALAAWRKGRKYAAASPWFLPSPRRKGHPVTAGSLTRALARLGPIVVGRRLTSHGLRSYYVTARRAQGVSDAQIAAEIGDVSGAQLIVSTYGAIPPGWRGGPEIGWLPKEEPAWARIPSGIPSPRVQAPPVRTLNLAKAQ